MKVSIVAFQAIDPGSIAGRCIVLLSILCFTGIKLWQRIIGMSVWVR